MAQIPPAAWLGIGTVVSVMSLLNDSLLLFIIPGVGFILFGAGKLMTGSDTKQASAPEHTYNTKPSAVNTDKDYVRCYVCSAKNSTQANYCGHCGHKLP